MKARFIAVLRCLQNVISNHQISAWWKMCDVCNLPVLSPARRRDGTQPRAPLGLVRPCPAARRNQVRWRNAFHNIATDLSLFFKQKYSLPCFGPCFN